MEIVVQLEPDGKTEKVEIVVQVVLMEQVVIVVHSGTDGNSGNSGDSGSSGTDGTDGQ